MNRNNRKTLLTRLVILPAMFSAVSATANVVPDSGFEQGNWKVGSNHSIINTNTHSGNRALRLTSTGAAKSSTTVSRRIAVSPGEEYTFDAWVSGSNLRVKSGGGDTPLGLVRFYRAGNVLRNAEGKATEGYRWVPKTGTFAYTNSKMQMRMQVPNGATHVEVGARTWAFNRSGQTFWDDITLTKVSFPDRGAATATLQADKASISGGAIKTHHRDYTGAGYLDVTGAKGALEWNNVAGGGQRVFSVRYAWEGFVRPLTLIVNGTRVGSATPLATGRRGLWATQDFVANLPAGNNNRVRLEVGRAGGALGQPMIDKVTVYVKGGAAKAAVSGVVSTSAPDGVVAANEDKPQGQKVSSAGSGLRITADASSQQRTLRVWLSGQSTDREPLDVSFTAQVGNSTPYVTPITSNAAGTTRRVITLTYSAPDDAQADQPLTADLVLNSGQWASIDAVALDDGAGNAGLNAAPLTQPIPDQSILAGDVLHLELVAEDPEGSAVSYSVSHDLPGAAPVLENSGDGIGVLNWSSPIDAAGDYTIRVTAADAEQVSTTREIHVRLEPLTR